MKPPRPASKPAAPGRHEPAAEAKAGEERSSVDPTTRPAPGGVPMPARPGSPSPAADPRTVGHAGAKAGEGPARSLRAPVTLPAPGGLSPTARLILPAGAPEADWHAVRRAGIGGSDVAAILGMHRYKGPLHVWEEKHGRGDHSDSEAAYCGRKFEGVIAEMFGERTGLELVPTPGTLQHIERPWMLANIDRLVIEEEPIVGYPDLVPLEVKNRSEYQLKDWADDAPDEPALQAHWYTAVGGYSHSYVAALIGGNKLRWYRLERDEELIEHLVTYCGDWWQQHVVEGAPPPPDGSKATTELLAHLWDVRPDATAEIDPVEHMILTERRRELKARLEADGHELTEIENQMRAALGDAEVATIGGRPVYTWRQNGNFASARFRDAEPELAAEYVHMVPAVDTERLSADHPETYRTYRARRLVVPSEGTS